MPAPDSTQDFATVVCHLPSGDLLTLPLTRLSLVDAFVLTMRPPPIGTRMEIQLGPHVDLLAFRIKARVIGARIDPSNAASSGFEVVFVNVGEDALVALSSFLAAHAVQLDPSRFASATKKVHERREFPRVKVELRANVNLDGDMIFLTVHDISMSGAYLYLGPGPQPAAFRVGARLTVTVFKADPGDCVVLPCTIARMGLSKETPGFGVQFDELDAPTQERLEQLIIESVLAQTPTIPP